MELTFLGRGAGFNPKEGSNAAYFMDGDECFLIDCGESIFKAVVEKKILDGAKALNILITHTHADHVGSLGTLILYAYAAKKIPVRLLVDDNMGYLPSLRMLLVINGLTESMYSLVKTQDFDGKYSLFSSCRYIPVPHTAELSSNGILFETPKGLVFYSGDLNTTEALENLVKSGKPINKIYVDTSSDRDNTHHISVHHVNDVIPTELKSTVYCMHINNEECIQSAEAYGFKVVSVP